MVAGSERQSAGGAALTGLIKYHTDPLTLFYLCERQNFFCLSIKQAAVHVADARIDRLHDNIDVTAVRSRLIIRICGFCEKPPTSKK